MIETPLEPGEIEIHGMRWKPNPSIPYKNRYDQIFVEIEKGHGNEISWYRELCKTDLWFLTYFVLKITCANHEWWVRACNEVEDGPDSHTLDLWARGHGKSTIITVARTIQRILIDPEQRICIFSYTKSAANGFLHDIKQHFERNEMLRACFPDIIWNNPEGEAPKWGLDSGLWLKRLGFGREATVEAWGLIEGMPTGKHFTGMVYDDIMTLELTTSPELIQKVKDAFDMSMNLGTHDSWHCVIGTTYHHEDVLAYVRNKKSIDGQPIYKIRVKPATRDGTSNGESAYLPEEKLAELRTNRQMFNSQQLLDPTPIGEQRLSAESLIEVEPDKIPKHLFKFMAIDPAGMRADKRQGDSWAMFVVGVRPYLDDLGASDIYILDAIIEPMTEAQALDSVIKMYTRNGRIIKLGIEKAGMSTAEIHVSNALRARGRILTVENGGIELLRPAGRSKEQRIESCLSWPLMNGKIHISTGVRVAFRERIKQEMQKFPFSKHDDALDALSYVYDLIKGYRFGKLPTEVVEAYDDEEETVTKDGWMIV